MSKKFFDGLIRKIKIKNHRREKSSKAKKNIKQGDKQKKSGIPEIYFVKPKDNPIISPNPRNDWESWQTFNPGVILLNDRVHFLYRAIGEDGISRFGYAVSNDGFNIDERLPYPVYEHKITKVNGNYFYYSFASGGSLGGSEDPRIVRVDGEDTLYMTYTACDGGLRVALTSIKVNDFLNRNWKWEKPKLISPPGKVNKNWVVFPDKINGKYAILHSISPNILVDYRDSLDFKEGEYIESYYNGQNKDKSSWDGWVRGAGAPPIKTEKGWIIFYHAIDKNDPGKYKVGAMLLDLNDPTKVISRASEPILEPNEAYENDGFKSGVVYVSGAVIKDGNILLYYGASDSYVSVAWANLDKFLNKLAKSEKPKLKVKKIKRKKKRRTIKK